MALSEQEKSDLTATVAKMRLVDGKSIHGIRRATGLSRKTIRKLLGLARKKPRQAKAPERTSILTPYEDEIRKALEDCAEMKAPALLDRLRAKGYQGGITVVRDRLRQVRPKPRQEAFFTRSYAPGQMLQVDWADFGYAIPGVARRVSAFVAALPYSRYLFLTFVLSQSMGCFLRCMDQALHFFGGRTLVDVFDNMKTVVLERKAQTVLFHPTFVEYARVRGLGIQACTPRRPTEKPYVERPIGFIRTRFWPGRRFADLFDLNVQATTWRDDIANNRIHEETAKVPSLVFEHEEKKRLQPLLPHFFDTDEVVSTGVTKTFRVTFDRNTYSVPWRLVGQSVLVRANQEQVSIFLGSKRVAVHNRCWDVGEAIKDDSHEQGLLEQKPRAAAGALPPELQGLGEVAAKYFKILAANTRSLRREIQRLVLLSELYEDTAVRAAMNEVMATGHVGSEYVEYVLRNKKGLRPGPTPLRLNNAALDGIHLGEPDLSTYDPPPRKTLDPGEPPEGVDL